VVINQNYESGWQANTGEIGAYLVTSHHPWLRSSGRAGETPPVGLLSVSLPAGTHHLLLRHRPPGLWFGLLLTLLGIALSVTAIRKLTPDRIARIARSARRSAGLL
jgi:hypothetical protein